MNKHQVNDKSAKSNRKLQRAIVVSKKIFFLICLILIDNLINQTIILQWVQAIKINESEK